MSFNALLALLFGVRCTAELLKQPLMNNARKKISILLQPVCIYFIIVRHNNIKKSMKDFNQKIEEINTLGATCAALVGI